MLNHLKIRSKLILLVGPLVLFIVAVGYIAENAFRTGQSAMTTVFEDRVVPLRDLKVISDMYAVNVVDTAQGQIRRDVPNCGQCQYPESTCDDQGALGRLPRHVSGRKRKSDR